MAVSISYEPFERLIASFRNDGFLKEADQLQLLMRKIAWTTGSELIGELGQAIKKIKINSYHAFSDDIKKNIRESMEIPRPGRMIPASEVALFKIHRWSGITVLGFLLLHWLWGLTGHVAGRWVHLFPWFSKEGLGKVISDLKSVPLLIREGFSGKADQDQGTAIAGAVHGLGLLAATGMALTGSVLFFGIRPDGAMSGYVHMVKEFHVFIAGFLWAFLAGHVSMAILHQWQGDRVISRMFNLFRE